jgi:hypothetical protein
MHLENHMLLKKIELHMKKINLWKDLNKLWIKKDWTHLLLNKE